MGMLNIVDTGEYNTTTTDSPMDYNPDASTTKERLQNTLFNPAQAVEDSVDNGSIDLTDSDPLATITDASPSPDEISDSFEDTSNDISDFDFDVPDITSPQIPGLDTGNIIPEIPEVPEINPFGELTQDIETGVKWVVIGFVLWLIFS